MQNSLKRKTKIICTMGPASSHPDVIRRLIHAGLDIARLNFSHGDTETHRQTVENLRAAAQAEQKTVAILADLQGPKLRMGQLPDAGVPAETGRRLILTPADVPSDSPQPQRLPVGEKSFPNLVKPGDRILIDDGTIELAVEQVRGDEVEARVVVGGTIKSHKGINLPGLSSELPAIPDKDRQDLRHAILW
ncbi:MAG: pyruvate kinase, partial [Anaerolineaceae bacterium]